MTPQTVEDRVMHLTIGFFMLDRTAWAEKGDDDITLLAQLLEEAQICSGSFSDIAIWTMSLNGYYITGLFAPNTAGRLIEQIVKMADALSKQNPAKYASIREISSQMSEMMLAAQDAANRYKDN